MKDNVTLAHKMIVGKSDDVSPERRDELVSAKQAGVLLPKTTTVIEITAINVVK